MPRHPAPKFTKQHYEAVAAILVKYNPNDRIIRDIREEFVELFDEDNAMFDAQRFRAACNPWKEDNA
jgi:hypothetical protein